jgi:hypothetical protein
MYYLVLYTLVNLVGKILLIQVGGPVLVPFGTFHLVKPVLKTSDVTGVPIANGSCTADASTSGRFHSPLFFRQLACDIAFACVEIWLRIQHVSKLSS